MSGNGSSGARIQFGSSKDLKTATKTGDERVGQQGDYIQTLNTTALPLVYYAGGDFYVMERLIPVSDVSPYDVYRMLSSRIWPIRPLRTPSAEFHKPALESRLLRAISVIEPEIREASGVGPLCADTVEVLAQFHEPRYFENSMRHVTVHGDPTLENVMYRAGKNQGLVLIDPLPPTPYAPSVREMDLGKIAQSLAGFEHDRYGYPGEFYPSELVPWVRWVADLEDVVPAVILRWAIVHVVRTFPYISRKCTMGMLNGSLVRLNKALKEVSNGRGV